MTGLDRIAASPALAPLAAVSGDGARDLAAGIVAELGGRILAWAGGTSAAGWSQATGAAAFAPDAAELARGGDVYDLRGLAAGIGDQLGATPTEQGQLLRAVEDHARALAVQIHGLAGSDRQMDGALGAMAEARAAEAPFGVDGVIHRLDAATDRLRAENGG